MRNGSVVDLQIAPGGVTALVSGSAIVRREGRRSDRCRGRAGSAICRDCAGAIDSLVELLQGRFSKGVMARLCEEKTGLFPAPKEIPFTCSCPDWASMCKHVAAVLYGIGARLDQQPELLFTLRKVDQQDLIAKAGSDLSATRKAPRARRVLVTDDLSAMFGIEMAPSSASWLGEWRRSCHTRESTKEGSAMKKSKAIRLVLLGSTGLTLAACDQSPPSDATFFSKVEDCIAVKSESTCRDGFAKSEEDVRRRGAPLHQEGAVRGRIRCRQLRDAPGAGRHGQLLHAHDDGLHDGQRVQPPRLPRPQ